MGGDVVAFSCCCFARRAGGVCGGLSGVESLGKMKGMDWVRTVLWTRFCFEFEDV